MVLEKGKLNCQDRNPVMLFAGTASERLMCQSVCISSVKTISVGENQVATLAILSTLTRNLLSLVTIISQKLMQLKYLKIILR